MVFTLDLLDIIFFITQPIHPESFSLLSSWFMQDHEEKKIKAEENKKMDKKKARIVSIAPINLQMVAMDIPVFI